MATSPNSGINGILINISCDPPENVIKYSIYETKMDSGAKPELVRPLEGLTPLNPNNGTSQITTSLIRIFNDNVSSLPEIYQKTYKYKNTTAAMNVMGRTGESIKQAAMRGYNSTAAFIKKNNQDDADKRVNGKRTDLFVGGYTRNKRVRLNRTLKY